MKKEILTISFDPHIPDMAEILPKAGFRRLSDATPEDLPAGSIVAVYNDRDHSMYSIVIIEHYNDTYLSYLNFNYLTTDDECSYKTRADFTDRWYKILGQLPIIDNKPQTDSIPEILEKAGFASLRDATPETLPNGCVAFLYKKSGWHSGSLVPVIIRTLSMSNRRLLYLREQYVAGNWESKVIMDNNDSFENYYYNVVS